MTRPMRRCRVCGAEFESSPADFTVNCPAHRGRPDRASTESYRKPPPDRFALGRAHGLQGQPRLQTGMLDYHRGYDEGVAERQALDDDLAQAIASEENRQMEQLDRKLRRRPSQEETQ